MDNATTDTNTGLEEATAIGVNAAADAADKAKAEIPSAKVKSYQDEVWLSSWKRRSAGMWAGTLCGAGFGAGIAAVSCLATTVITGAALLPMLATIVPAMAVLGIGLGIGAFTLVGATSGAVAHGLKVQDKRNREAGKATEQAIEEPKKNSVPFLNWKVAVAGFALAAPVGWLFAATGAAAGLGGAVLGGLHLSQAAMTCLSVMTFGLNGAIFGLDGPKISMDATNMMGKFLSGKIFERESSTPAPSVARAPAKAIPEYKSPKMEVAFQSDAGIKNNVAPIGQYAGKDAGFHTRRLAEQQFHAMDPRNSIPH